MLFIDRMDPDLSRRLARLDLNLLVALDALLEERHVTRAGRRVGLSQPAMSNALARLRRMLDDPLLVRTPAGMAPSPRAEALADPLREALRAVDDAERDLAFARAARLLAWALELDPALEVRALDRCYSILGA